MVNASHVIYLPGEKSLLVMLSENSCCHSEQSEESVALGTDSSVAAFSVLLQNDNFGQLQNRRTLTDSKKRPLAMAYFPQRVPPSVSSALSRFTAVFGKGTGGSSSLLSPGGAISRF